MRGCAVTEDACILQEQRVPLRSKINKKYLSSHIAARRFKVVMMFHFMLLCASNYNH
jgi:hypothetical protein